MKNLENMKFCIESEKPKKTCSKEGQMKLEQLQGQPFSTQADAQTF